MRGKEASELTPRPCLVDCVEDGDRDEQKRRGNSSVVAGKGDASDQQSEAYKINKRSMYGGVGPSHHKAVTSRPGRDLREPPSPHHAVCRLSKGGAPAIHRQGGCRSKGSQWVEEMVWTKILVMVC